MFGRRGWGGVAVVLATAVCAPVGEVRGDESRVGGQPGKGTLRLLSVDDAEAAPPFGAGWFADIGVLVSEDGHVIGEADLARRSTSIVAILANQNRYSGTVVAVDGYSNLALYKLSGPQHEPPLPADEDSVAEGDYVTAVVGTSDGRRETVRARVLDARRVLIAREHPPLPYIEIEDSNPDLPVRGPVFDATGKLVAFVTLRTRPEHKTQSVLAVRASDMLSIAQELRTWGRVRRSRIGLGVATVPRELAVSRGLGESTGALIGEVQAGSPAARVGLLVNEIIVKLDQSEIGNTRDYLVAMQRTRPGTIITLEVVGAAGKRRVHVRTAEIVSGAPPRDDRKTLPEGN